MHHPTQRHMVLAGGEDGSLTVWDLRHNTFPVTLLSAHSDTGTAVTTRAKSFCIKTLPILSVVGLINFFFQDLVIVSLFILFYR